MRKFRVDICLFLVVLFIGNSCAKENIEVENAKKLAQINEYVLTVGEFNDELGSLIDRERSGSVSIPAKKEFLNNLIIRELLLQEAQRRDFDKEAEFVKTIEHFWKETLIKMLLDRRSKEIISAISVYDNEIERYYQRMAKKIETRIVVFKEPLAAEKLAYSGDKFEDALTAVKDSIVTDELKWIEVGDLDAELEELVFSLSEGKVHPPLQRDFRWIVVRMIQIVPREIEPLVSLRGQIERIIRERKETKALEDWLEELRKNAQVNINEVLLK